MANKNTIVKKIVVGTPVRTIQATQIVSTANISDVSVDSIAHGDLLVYDSASGKYTATSISGGNGINVTYTPGAFGDIEINATSSVSTGTYGSTARIPVISVDANGLIDSIGSVLVSVAGGDAITGIDYDSATGTLTVTTGDALTYSTVISLDAFNTDNLSEGSTNKYYTKARVDSDINALVDSAYIQARQADIFRDSSFITNIVTSEYIQARQADIYRDSGFVTNIVDSAYIQARQTDIRDSAFVTGIVTAGYIQANQNNYLDSTLAVQLIDTAHVQARQITYNTSDFLDSTTVALVVDSAYVQARQTTYDFLDSAEVIALVDSAYVQARQADVDLSTYATQTYVTNRVDSAINALIDAAPGALNTLNELAAALNNDDSFATTVTTSIATKLSSADFDTRFDSALGTKTTDDVTEGSTNLYFTDSRAQGAITVTDAGGDGSLAYTDGTITYTGPSASEVRAHFTAGPSIDITDGVVKVDSASTIKVAGIEADKLRTTDSGVRVYGNLLPDNNTRSLGDSINPWADVWVGPNSVYIGSARLYDSGGTISIGAWNSTIGIYYPKISLANNTTDDISEGSNNLYYTTARVDSAILEYVDSAYIQARQADIFRDSGFVTNIIDSAYVATKVAANVTTRYLQLDSNLPADTTNKLYSQNGNLYWNGAALDSLGIGYTPVNKAGDTMTGDLIINKTTPQIKLNDDDDAGVEIAIGLDGEDFYIYEPEDPGGTQVPYATFGVGKQWLRIEDVSEDAYLFGRLIWTSGNDGSGTGLDADLLDGQEGSYYLNYNNLTGKPNVLDSAAIGDLLGSLNEAAISSVVDSAYVQSRQITYSNVSEFANDANYLDSTTVQGVVNSAYVQARQITYSTADFLDSYYATALIDSAYINARVGAIDASGVDSAATILLIQETVDSAYVAARVGDLGIDSASTIALITETVDSAYINARVNANVDSAQVQLIIDSNFQNLSQTILPDLDNTRDLGSGSKRFRRIYAGSRIFLGTNLSLRDSSDTLVLSGGSWGINDQIDSYVDTAYVRARQDYAYSSLTGAPTNVSEFTNDANYLDSITIQGVVNQTFVRNLQITYNTSDFTDSAFVTGLPVSTFTNDANYLDSTTATTLVSALPVSTFTNDANYLDSTTATTLVSALPVSTFTNDANYLDSTSILGVLSARNGITYDNTTGIFGLDSQANVEFGNVTVDGTLLVNSSARIKGIATFETDVIVDGDFYVNGTQTTINTQSLSVSDNLIHLADSNELSDTLDIGFVGHYYGNGQRRHTGFFRDASNSQYYLFNNYVDSDLDSSVSTGEINRGEASFQLATLNVGTLIGDVTGNADTATTLQTSRKIGVQGHISADSNLFNGNADFTITNVVINNDVIVNDMINASAAIADTKLATISTAGKVSNSATTATDSNTASAIVARDASGNFSAGTITGTKGLFDGNTTSALDAYAANDGFGARIIRDLNDGNSPAALLVAGDGDATGDILFEVRSNTNGPSVDVTKTHRSIDTRFAILGGGQTIIAPTSRTDGIDSAGTAVVRNSSLLSVYGNATVDRLYVAAESSGGIAFPDDAFGGSGDTARIYLTSAPLSENTRLTIQTTNDIGDEIHLKTPSNNGVKINNYTVIHEENIGSFIDSNYINSLSFANIDSAALIAVVDSSYVQLRQNYAYSSLTGSPTNVSFFTNDANYLDSTTVPGVIDAVYIQANQTTYNTSDFLDSTTVELVVDSAYVNARINVGIGIQHFVYTATNGQTSFSGNDYYGNSLSYVNNKEQVYRNGVLLVRGDQYTATSGNSVVILNGCDSDDVISISAFSNTRFLDNVSDSGDGITVTGNLSVQGDLNFTGSIAIRGLQEPIVEDSSATGISQYNFDSASIFYELYPTSNWQANIINIPTTLYRSTTTNIVVTQGATAYIPNVLLINGDSAELQWQGGVAPGGTASGTDIFSFMAMRVLDSIGTADWLVLAHRVSYGG